jgi:signal transduction histidine kinase
MERRRERRRQHALGARFGRCQSRLAFAAVSSLLFAVGLIMTARAARTNTQLTTMRSDFVSAVTHELKTPIATIKGRSRDAGQGPTHRHERDHLRPYRGDGIQPVGPAGRQPPRLRTDYRRQRLVYVSDVEVAAIFNDIQQDFEARLDHQGFELHVAINPGVYAVSGDRFALRLLFGNLLDNAIKYSGDRRVISLRASLAESRVAIDVEDQGVGIAADEIPKVMRKFVRAREATGGGSGLGLSIASRIAKDHHGDLKIVSEVGRGTTVTVTLPVADGAVEQVA